MVKLAGAGGQTFLVIMTKKDEQVQEYFSMDANFFGGPVTICNGKFLMNLNQHDGFDFRLVNQWIGPTDRQRSLRNGSLAAIHQFMYRKREARRSQSCLQVG